jgi:hypothetical protein
VSKWRVVREDKRGWNLEDMDSIRISVFSPSGEKYVRDLNGMDDTDYQDLKIAQMFWDHGNRAAEMGYPEAALTEHCLAIERLFPHLREELPE